MTMMVMRRCILRVRPSGQLTTVSALNCRSTITVYKRRTCCRLLLAARHCTCSTTINKTAVGHACAANCPTRLDSTRPAIVAPAVNKRLLDRGGVSSATRAARRPCLASSRRETIIGAAARYYANGDPDKRREKSSLLYE